MILPTISGMRVGIVIVVLFLAIIEQKFRLETSLENERKEYHDLKQNYEHKLKEEREIHAKASQESNVRFESLQQHYKLEQSEHADLVEECSKTKKVQLEQINGLERKIKSLETLLAQAKSQHNKDVEHWTVGDCYDRKILFLS